MNKSEAKGRPSSASHRQTQHSGILNRRYVRRPKTIRQTKAGSRTTLSPVKRTPTTTSKAKPINEIVSVRRATMLKTSRPSAQETKNRAIKQALRSVTVMERKENLDAPAATNRTFTGGRIALALMCASISVAALAYFININMPNISVRVAAMQTGIDGSYPSYIPRDYSLANITSEPNRISLTFHNRQIDASFTLSEEKSSWDSSTLESNYATPNWSKDYTTIREQGLTIFVSGSNAAWVNGGILYKISASGNNLTKKQIRSIATSM